MCAIFGFSGTIEKELLDKMMKSLLHRGPDEQCF